MNGALIKSDDNMLPAPNQPSVDVSYFNQHELMYYERNGYRHIGQEFNLHVTLRAFAQMPLVETKSCEKSSTQVARYW